MQVSGRRVLTCRKCEIWVARYMTLKIPEVILIHTAGPLGAFNI
jgi:hypothetical protein